MSQEPRDVLALMDEVITSLESHPDPVVRSQVTQLLQGIDAVHRAGLTHMMDAIRGMAGDAFINRLTADPGIRLLLMSYDLVAVDRRLQAEEALDAVRGHLHSRGIDVELTEVIGGVVYVRLHGLDASGAPEEAVRRDIEAAIKEGLLGFQELVIGGTPPGRGGTAPASLVSIGGLRRARKPVYRRVAAVEDIPPGTMKSVLVDDDSILIVNLGDEFCALANHCGDGPMPLEFSTLTSAELVCSWHGCRYDVRTGSRLDGMDERIAIFPVAVVDGEVRVAIGTEPVGVD